jgi:hypothetical protein
LNQLAQIPLRGRDTANIHPARGLDADGPDLSGLQDTKQLSLQRERHIADFIEKQRAPVRLDEDPASNLRRARESTAGAFAPVSASRAPSLSASERLVVGVLERFGGEMSLELLKAQVSLLLEPHQSNSGSGSGSTASKKRLLRIALDRMNAGGPPEATSGLARPRAGPVEHLFRFLY